jgi:transcriptional regulator with XRE-family HTH domain
MQRLFDIVKAEDWLARTGKNRSDLARALGYERQAVGHWFRGRGEPNVQQMKVMAKELGCHWLELATEETIVVYQDEERARVEKIRALSKEELAELDAFLAFKEKLNV